MIEGKRTIKIVSSKNKTLLMESSFLVKKALSFLSLRNQKVLTLFFGLEGKNYSLSEIGKKMGITRERARQIKVESLKKIRKNFKSLSLSEEKDFYQKIEKVFQEEGGFLEVKRLGKLVFGKRNDFFVQLGRINLLLSLNDNNFSFKKKNLKTKSFWCWNRPIEGKGLDQEAIVSNVERLVNFLKEKNIPLCLNELEKNGLILSDEFSLATEIGKRRVENLLILSVALGKNILNQWGLLNWPIIASNVTREKSFLILKKSKKPLHFRKIAQLIRENWPEKKVVVQTVHNELIKDPRFVLVGRGVYSLVKENQNKNREIATR